MEAVKMLRVLLGLFIIAHGLITFGIWAAPVTEQAPFNPNHSWLLGDTRTLAIALAVLAAIAFVVTGGGFLTTRTGGRSPRSRQVRERSCRWPCTSTPGCRRES
jgi:hypothetical protein